tara:strand:- start:3443 stop:3763 length:321 start_codon:yes stop_codon:yes gene_type:complete
LKVKISYTVDFESVPNKVADLLSERTEQLEHAVGTLENIARQARTGDVTSSIEGLDDLRKSLLEVDTALMDSYNLAVSYLQAKANLAAQVVAEQQTGGTDDSGEQG